MFNQSNETPTWKGYIAAGLLILAVVLIFRVIIYALSNPTLTHTQIFIAMLPFELLAVLCALLGGIIRNHEESEM